MEEDDDGEWYYVESGKARGFIKAKYVWADEKAERYVKHKKEKNDAAKGKIFTIIGRELAVAVKEGGSDPNNNSRLRDVIAKAKANNMPNENIKRSIAKAAGELGNVDAEQAEMGTSAKGSLIDMLLPIGSLIFFAVVALLYSGGYWGSDPAYHTLAAAFGNSSASKALVWASFGAITVAFFLFVPRGLMSLKSFMDCAGEGMKAMMPANTILVLAWTISGVCRDLLQTPLFVKTMVADGGISGGLLPAIIFVVAGFLSFSTGTAWGTFGILIPIVVPVAQAVDPNLVLVCLSATLAGSVFGDHCSPISDTTILSSAGAGCAHLEHVSTQMLYACVVAASSTVGYVVSGLTHGSLWPGFVAGLAFMVVTMLVLRQRNKQKDVAQA